MPLQQTTGNVTTDAYGGGVAAVPNYIEDVFSTYLYTGNGSTQTINNGIDLAGKGGLAWVKARSGPYASDPTYGKHTLTDSTADYYSLASNNTDAIQPYAGLLFEGATNGFIVPTNADKINNASSTYASWSFRKQPKFFDVVTWTGDGTSYRTITHNLGSTPGFIVVKRTDSTGDWVVFVPSATAWLTLNTTNAAGASNTTGGYPSALTSTDFLLNPGTGPNVSNVNANGGTYVAYLFASNAGGFGLTGTDNVITCGSFTTDGSGLADVNLGYEPQYLLLKKSSSTGSWYIFDTMRGFSLSPAGFLYANLSNAESNTYLVNPTATGFHAEASASTTYIYIAIRRGPMKVPTSGTSVFAPVARAGTNSEVQVTSGFPTDLFINLNRSHEYFANNPFFDRLRGLIYSNSNSTSSESSGSPFLTAYGNTGVTLTNSGLNSNATTYITYSMGRAPGFFDEVCYTGTGANTTQNHNLGVAPELVIVKARNNTNNWQVYNAIGGAGNLLLLNTAQAYQGGTPVLSPTSTTIGFAYNADYLFDCSGSGVTYVAYLFATLAGVSKVGSYTGTGTLTTINCGFSGGARFVLIKRTDSGSNWFVWDTSRGMVAGTDPVLYLNNVTAESNANSVYTITSGFQLLASPSADVNTNGGSYIYLAIA